MSVQTELLVGSLQGVEPILDDGGLIRLLKLPEGANLEHYRNRCGLPYCLFKKGNAPIHRYVTSQVMQWMIDRQRNAKAQDKD